MPETSFIPDGDLLSLSELRAHIRIIPNGMMTEDEFLHIDLVLVPSELRTEGLVHYLIIKNPGIRLAEFAWWPSLVAALPSACQDGSRIWRGDKLTFTKTDAAMFILFFAR